MQARRHRSSRKPRWRIWNLLLLPVGLWLPLHFANLAVDSTYDTIVVSEAGNATTTKEAAGQSLSHIRLPALTGAEKNGGIQKEYPLRNLTFLHIPKTGGSSIIKASLAANVTWGDCLFRNRTRTFQCSAFSILHRPCPNVRWQGCTKHLPMQYLHRFEHRTTACNPYEGSDVFTVVRNPFARVLSEFYYNCLVAKRAICKPRMINDADYMNQAIEKKLKWRFNNCQSPSKKCYFANCNHDIAQWDYIFENTGTMKKHTNTMYANTTKKNTVEEHERPRQLVQWVLHLERIQDEFIELMRRYGLQDTVHFPKQRLNAGKNNLLTVANFTPSTIEWITKVYSKDFEAFGYSKVPLLEASLPLFF